MSVLSARYWAGRVSVAACAGSAPPSLPIGPGPSPVSPAPPGDPAAVPSGPAVSFQGEGGPQPPETS